MTSLASLALLALLASPAQAASRMVIEVQGQWTVILGTAPVVSPTSVGRTTLNGISAGQHRLQVLDPQGLTVYAATIEVPDNASVSATWDGTAMHLVGAWEASSLTAEGVGAHRDASDQPEAQDVAALERANDQDPNNQRASAHGQGAYTEYRQVGGTIPTQVTDAVGTAATVTLGVDTSLLNVAGSAVQGFSYMVQTAEAGGTRRYYSPDARQGNPNVPPPILEEVKLVNVGGQPMTVYVEGMVLHDFDEGETEKTFKIEVGRRELQFVDRRTRQLVHQGSLRIKEDFVIVLEFSPTQPPRATNANWAWASL